MTLIDRVKERVEQALSDAELQLLIDEALVAIEDAYGPPANPATPITVQLDGCLHMLDLLRPIDVAQAKTITEHVGSCWGYSAIETTTVLVADDYRVWHGGRSLERLATGTNPRQLWGSRVEVAYVPVNDGNQRQEVTIKLVALAVQYKGANAVTVGDVSTRYNDYQAERNRLLRSLAPRRGLMLR